MHSHEVLLHDSVDERAHNLPLGVQRGVCVRAEDIRINACVVVAKLVGVLWGRATSAVPCRQQEQGGRNKEELTADDEVNDINCRHKAQVVVV